MPGCTYEVRRSCLQCDLIQQLDSGESILRVRVQRLSIRSGQIRMRVNNRIVHVMVNMRKSNIARIVTYEKYYQEIS